MPLLGLHHFIIRVHEKVAVMTQFSYCWLHTIQYTATTVKVRLRLQKMFRCVLFLLLTSLIVYSAKTVHSDNRYSNCDHHHYHHDDHTVQVVLCDHHHDNDGDHRCGGCIIHGCWQCLHCRLLGRLGVVIVYSRTLSAACVFFFTVCRLQTVLHCILLLPLTSLIVHSANSLYIHNQ